MGDKERQTSGQKHSASQPQEQTTTQAPPPIEPPPANPLPPPPNAPHEPNDGDDKIKKSDRIMIAATIVIALGTLVSAAAIVLQWREMVSGGTATDRLVEYAKIQANAASDQGDAAQQFSDTAEDINGNIAEAERDFSTMAHNSERAIRATQESMRQDQRAWLGAGDYIYSIGDSGPIDSTAIVTNTGKSPALEILCRITGTTKPKGYVLSESGIVYPSELLTVKQGALFPGQHFPLKAGGPPMDPVKQKVWFENVQNGEWVQYFFGEVRYDDAFAKPHWTHFCTQYVPSTKSGTPCPVYNDTNDRVRQEQAVSR